MRFWASLWSLGYCVNYVPGEPCSQTKHVSIVFCVLARLTIPKLFRMEKHPRRNQTQICFVEKSDRFGNLDKCSQPLAFI